MRFSWDFLQNMLENGHSNLQTNLWVHTTSNIFKISNSKIMGSHQPPDLPTLKAYPTPGVGGRFIIFSLKWRERMNLKVPGAILPFGCAILSTRAKTVRGVGTTPLGELGLKGSLSFLLSKFVSCLIEWCFRKETSAACIVLLQESEQFSRKDLVFFLSFFFFFFLKEVNVIDSPFSHFSVRQTL